jgi:hypothetical protein
MGTTHNSKTDEVVTADWEAPEADGTANELDVIVVGTAPQHAVPLRFYLYVFSPIRPNVRITKGRPAYLFTPQAPRPFPDVPRHVHAAVR